MLLFLIFVILSCLNNLHNKVMCPFFIRPCCITFNATICHLSPVLPSQGVNSMFQVFLTGNNSEYFTMSPTAVQGRADIRMRVAMPLDYEHIRSYSFSVSSRLMLLPTTSRPSLLRFHRNAALEGHVSGNN